MLHIEKKNKENNDSWKYYNLEYLKAGIAMVKEYLEDYIRKNNKRNEEANEETLEKKETQENLKYNLPNQSKLYASQIAFKEAEKKLVTPSALQILCKKFELTNFERDLLLLCAGMELDNSILPLCKTAQDNRRSYPNFQLAFSVLPNPHWNAAISSRPLRKWKLIDMGGDDTFVWCSLRIQEKILFHLIGLSIIDTFFEGIITPIKEVYELSPSQEEKSLIICKNFADENSDDFPVLQIYGPDFAGKRSIAVCAAKNMGKKLYLIRSNDFPVEVNDRDKFTRLWEREAQLENIILFVDFEDSTESIDNKKNILPILEAISTPMIISCQDPIIFHTRSTVRIEMKHPTNEEQLLIWSELIDVHKDLKMDDFDEVAAQFNMSSDQIRNIVSELKGISKIDNLKQCIWDKTRVYARKGMDDLAQRITATATWDDLCVIPAHKEVLYEIVRQMKNRMQVYEKWGFSRGKTKGIGILTLFSGPSGTGKTLAAEVIANELNLDLYRVDISSVVSKFVGETEKNLRKLFDRAEEAGAVLLFDEADSLFSKRTETNDSRDRSSNMEVGYLLQRVESYRGLAILTTNFSLQSESNVFKNIHGNPTLEKRSKSDIDTAFLRRIRFIVRFELPSFEQRKEIWQQIFPNKIPKKGINYDLLAQLDISGGMIYNVSLNAAFKAAEDKEPLQMKHISAAVEQEFKKLQKPFNKLQMQNWETNAIEQKNFYNFMN